jgi:HAD superfamily hydrolase (TIGR01662 family)
MDGTIIDVEDRFERMGKVRSEVMKKTVGDNATELWAKASGFDLKTGKVQLRSALTTAPRREDLILASTVIAINGEKWGEAKKIAEQIYTEADKILASTYKPILLPGVKKALKRMRKAGIKLALATNAPKVSARDLMQSVNLNGFFDVIIGSDDVEHIKPAPDMILLACERSGFTSSESIYIGDMPRDMMAGRNAGVAAVVAVKSTFFSDSDYSDYDTIIDSFEDFKIL